MVTDELGGLLWISSAIRGSIHDTAASRIWQIPRLLREVGLFAVGDKGYRGDFLRSVVAPSSGLGF